MLVLVFDAINIVYYFSLDSGYSGGRICFQGFNNFVSNIG